MKELSGYLCTNAYIKPKNQLEWDKCPKCDLRPLVWEFDNGRSTACGCGKSKYDHLRVEAESIGSVYRRTGKTVEYKNDQLKYNWNKYCKSGIVERVDYD